MPTAGASYENRVDAEPKSASTVTTTSLLATPTPDDTRDTMAVSDTHSVESVAVPPMRAL